MSMRNDVEVRVRTYAGMDYGPDLKLESVSGGRARVSILCRGSDAIVVEVVIEDLIDALTRCKP